MSNEAEQATDLLTKYPQILPAVVTFILNLVVTFLMIRREKNQFESRRSNDRKYQSDLFLYQNLIIKEVEKYVDCANKVDKAFVELCEAIIANSRNKRKTIEKTQELVDHLDRQIRSDIISKTHVFSADFAKKSDSLWNDFYDGSTIVISKLDRVSITQEVCHKHRSEMSGLKEKFLHDLFKVIKEFHPQYK